MKVGSTVKEGGLSLAVKEDQYSYKFHSGCFGSEAHRVPAITSVQPWACYATCFVLSYPE